MPFLTPRVSLVHLCFHFYVVFYLCTEAGSVVVSLISLITVILDHTRGFFDSRLFCRLPFSPRHPPQG